jgi:protoheme IX farnesyltransferase
MSQRVLFHPTFLRAAPRTARDLIALTKPSITAMAGVVALAAMLMAPGLRAPREVVLSLMGIMMAVAGAGALNMLVERDVDALMTRTALRPLPTGRLPPASALVIGAALCVVALLLLYLVASPLTCALTAFSLFVYVAVYTPMKRTSPWSLLVGAVPGAMPALMGASVTSGRIERVGVVLFLIVFLWQLPHFIAISIYRRDEYVRAGHQIVPARWGLPVAKALTVATTVLLAAVSVAPAFLSVASVAFGTFSGVVSAWFVWVAARGLRQGVDAERWARQVFFASLTHQTLLFFALAVDAVVARAWS